MKSTAPFQESRRRRRQLPRSEMRQGSAMPMRMLKTPLPLPPQQTKVCKNG